MCDLVLGWDGANCAGFALATVCADPRISLSGVVRGTTDARRLRNLWDAVNKVQAACDDLVVCVFAEQPWLHGESPESKRAYGKLCRVTGWIEAAAAFYSYPARLVRPEVWRAAMIGGPANRSREDWKRIALAMVRSLDMAPVTHDEAEACLIALYGAKTIWLERATNVKAAARRARRLGPPARPDSGHS
jgi:hypothetical protein